ncbi:hypothetical protein [Variovorax beijingensis]|uniref:hypothetical protein n=1 Tax=Variovorax beijingensis TaxID=2496117 RepID=UPI0011AA785C|nr:hypothetical protein [Variovorax beijingensis]
MTLLLLGVVEGKEENFLTRAVKAPPPDGAHPFRKGFVATEKTKKPEPVLKPVRALLPDTSLAALAAGVV